MYNHALAAPQSLKGISLFVFIVNNCVCYLLQNTVGGHVFATKPNKFCCNVYCYVIFYWNVGVAEKMWNYGNKILK